MQSQSRFALIEKAFHDAPSLRAKLFEAIDKTPQYAPLFEEIAVYTEGIRSSVHSRVSTADDDHASKKRKIGVATERNGIPSHIGRLEYQSSKVFLEARDLSFQIPVRKKLNLTIAQFVNGHNEPQNKFSVQVKNGATDTVEYETICDDSAITLRFPVPEKAQKQFNYCLLPTSVGSGDATPEPLLWTVNGGTKVQCQIFDPSLQQRVVNSDRVLEDALEYTVGNGVMKVIQPEEAEFVSATPESHRKNEKAYHVKAFKGSKDGFLFFLSNGIFFGFKKPLQFFQFHDINSISYTSILQRTFNLNINYSTPDSSEGEKEVEFSMIDQGNFAGIDAYVKRHQLNDASMVEARKAKIHNVNRPKKGDVDQQGTHLDDPGELQKAEQQIQEQEDDEEDELEEDYDPGSDGQSDGSGSSSEEEDEFANGGPDEGNLVEDELGSEVEEAGPDLDDEDQL